MNSDFLGPKVVAFGSQALSFNRNATSLLLSQWLNQPHLDWIRDVFLSLPDLWTKISTADDRLRNYPGANLLSDLGGWLESGVLAKTTYPLPNILLTPLVVLTQFVEYYQVLKDVSSLSILDADPHEVFATNSEFFGQCTGLLTAAALGCSRTSADLQLFGSVAIRLAMLIGAIIDIQESEETLHGGSKSFAVQWKLEQPASFLEDILDQFSEAYVSVKTDQNRATVTASGRCAKDVQVKLAATAIAVQAVNLRGCFHCLCHSDNFSLMTRICDMVSALRLPPASALVRPVRTDHLGENLKDSSEDLHQIIIRSMLIEQADWQRAFSKIWDETLQPRGSILLCIGPDCYVPRKISQLLENRVVQAASLRPWSSRTSINHVAVIGMACQVPGANNIEEFWQLLCNAEPQHKTVPKDRFAFETAWRNSQRQAWYGNFLQDEDVFDHKFFQKSPREAATMDPQHRLILQTAYQAVEQSGYFNSTDQDRHIGCYIGVSNNDYEKNVNCYAENAYSATGNLKSFASGRISHYFGWTGPSITIDTACSSSAVAIHSACKAILGGECSRALVGGVNVMTTPDWFQNLSGASFLSDTGQSRPFDSQADGYCRAEGVGAVFLKKLSSAIHDGNQILGIINASAVYQNQSCTPITVPNIPSLSDMFCKTLREASLDATQISYVEAHAAGTAVGDPAEYSSICEVFGEPNRSSVLQVGSVKGLIGHAECASGILALIKVLVMFQKHVIPPQVGLRSLNPAIHMTADDNIDITTQLKPWNVDFRAAVVSNLGASGSNTCIVVTEPPRRQPRKSVEYSQKDVRYPFIISGLDERSVKAYSAELHSALQKYVEDCTLSIAQLSFQVMKQHNPNLQKSYIFECSSVDELKRKLKDVKHEDAKRAISERRRVKPVILCFGGQNSTVVGINRTIYDQSTVFRHHLDECNKACNTAGVGCVIPDIFLMQPFKDIVKLQLALFSIQYACAKSWIDCGIQVEAVVGLSFGEFTALCVSGALSLQDAIKLIAGRARIIRDDWEADTGSMLAIEGDLESVQTLLTDCRKRNNWADDICIGCYIGSKNHTISGSTQAVATAATMIESNPAYSSLKSREIDVTHAFHSPLTNSVLNNLEQFARQFDFQNPTIHFERAVDDERKNEGLRASNFVVEHLRQPAFYDKAVKRLAERHPSCIWLEAGSNSGIAQLTRRAVDHPKSFHFQSLNLTSKDPISCLTDTATGLWKAGAKCLYWLHHPSQISDHPPFFLPPYQFEKHRHWLPLKKPLNAVNNQRTPSQENVICMWTFLGYSEKGENSAWFRINIRCPKYLEHIQGHRVAQAAYMCSSSTQLEIVIDAISSLRPEFRDHTFLPELQDMKNVTPMVLDHNRDYMLSATTHDNDKLFWQWEISSTKRGTATSQHVSGSVVFRPASDVKQRNEFAKFERLVPRTRCTQLLTSNNADEIMQGRGIYKAFQLILEYSEVYKGVKKFVSKGNDSAGIIHKPSDSATWINAGLFDSFCQVAGMAVNNTLDSTDDNNDIYISSGIDQSTRSPDFLDKHANCDTWEVFSINTPTSPKEYVSDVFVFSAETGALAEVILGIRYSRISKSSLKRTISRLTVSDAPARTDDAGTTSSSSSSSSSESDAQINTPPSRPSSSSSLDKHEDSPSRTSSKTEQQGKPLAQISTEIRDLLAEVIGIEPSEIMPDSRLESLGIDSLMGIELAREIETVFGCKFSAAMVVDFHTVADLDRYVGQKG